MFICYRVLNIINEIDFSIIGSHVLILNSSSLPGHPWIPKVRISKACFALGASKTLKIDFPIVIRIIIILLIPLRWPFNRTKYQFFDPHTSWAGRMKRFMIFPATGISDTTRWCPPLLLNTGNLASPYPSIMGCP